MSSPLSRIVITSTALVFLVQAPKATAWWDTRIEVARPPTLLTEYPATQSVLSEGVKPEKDAQANGGKGGEAVWLPAGAGSIATKVELKPGLYAWHPIARLRGDKDATVLLFSLTVFPAKGGGEPRSWILPGNVGKFYGASPRFYFPIYEAGEYTVSLQLLNDGKKLGEIFPKEGTAWNPRPKRELIKEPLSESDMERFRRMFANKKGVEKDLPQMEAQMNGAEGILIDRFELRTPLAGRKLQQTKKGRTLTDTRSKEILEEASYRFSRTLLGDPEKVWEQLPDFNALTLPSGCYVSLINNGLISLTRRATEEQDSAAAEEAAVLLCGIAERWPALDFHATGFGDTSVLLRPGQTAWHTSAANAMGKHVYRGWAGKPARVLLASYDVLFDYIKGNQKLATFLGTKIPGIQTPDDVIAFLDERLIWSVGDQIRRLPIGDDESAIVAALVWGAGSESEEILRTTAFHKVHRDMAHLGGIDDHAAAGYSRDGLAFIGSVGYMGQSLVTTARMLDEYLQIGGKKEFGIFGLPVGRSAELNEEGYAALHLAGGFVLVQGDAGDLRRGRVPEFSKGRPSRVLGGSGFTMLESGQFGDNPLRMRGLGFTWGGGRGHAHSDTLNFELFVQGARISPDLGGRHEEKLHGRPNMRSNRVHNLVEVDDRDFWNEGLSIMPATGWLVSFAPQEGSQFVEHGARAKSHPDVSFYGRQTALIDVEGPEHEESYVFGF